MSVVLDASAVLALLLREPGSDRVAAELNDAAISAVNLAEVYTKCVDRGLDLTSSRHLLDALQIRVVPFNDAHAFQAGQLRIATRSHGLSLGDRACLATAILEKSAAITADRAWLKLGLDLEIVSIR